MNYYNKYSDYLKNKYGEKVYKLPVNLPITCPNRIAAHGCTFCSDLGTGFESMHCSTPITKQLEDTKTYIAKKYGAKKYIAYFQNFTNTFLPLELFRINLIEACKVEDIVEISISTRPDCIRKDYLDVLQEIQNTYHIQIAIELGLQTVNYHTLEYIERGHSLAEYIDAMMQIKAYGYTVCTHVILNLPGDTMLDVIETSKIVSVLKTDIVKVHSLYIAKNTKMCEQYLANEFQICTKEEYLARVAVFLDYLAPNIIVERLFSRIPKEDMTFSNWNTSWWKLQDECMALLEQEVHYQGRLFDYTGGTALKKLV